GPDFAVIEHDSDFNFSAPQKFIDEAGPVGIYERLPAESLSDKKVRMLYNLQLFWSSLEVICGCIFALAPVRYMKIRHLVEAIRAITGFETSLWELMKLGEKRLNMFRVFNLREGFTFEDDILPDRMFQPIQSGPRKGQKLDKDEFNKARSLYYEMMGWNDKGIPGKGKLSELDLGWIEEYLPTKNE
ncbi:aldehyde ferredoxin oxidoreductase, partial [Candidatus Aerophobetes bacterium]